MKVCCLCIHSGARAHKRLMDVNTQVSFATRSLRGRDDGDNTPASSPISEMHLPTLKG